MPSPGPTAKTFIPAKPSTTARLAKFLRQCASVLVMGCAVAAQALPMQRDKNDGGEDFRSLLERGFALHQEANYAEALPLLKRAWKLDPHDYFANLLVGIDLLRTGQQDASIPYLREASHLRPAEDFPLEYLGEAEAQLRKYDVADEAYERALTVAPGSPQAVEAAVGYWVERFRELAAQLRATTRGLAAEHRLQARAHALHDVARQDLLARSASLDANAPGIWSELALAKIAGGDAANAETDMARAREHDPHDLDAELAYAMVAAQRGQWAAASESLESIGRASPGVLTRATSEWPRELQPPTGTALAPLATAFFACANAAQPCSIPSAAHGERAGSPANVSAAALYREQRWERLIALPAPRIADAQAWFRLGVAYAELGHCKDSIAALERLVAQGAGDMVYAKFLLSSCYAGEAGRVMQSLHQKDSEDAALLHMVRGDVLLRMQADSVGAATEYAAALSAHPNDPELLERLAESQYESQQFAPAAENANAALRIDPHRFSAMQTLARIAVEQRKYADAVPYLEKIAEHDPKNASAQVELGNALAQTGNPEGAAQHLGPALAAGYPDEKGSLHAALGAALRKLGRNAEAAKAFAQAREFSEAYQRNPHRGEDDAK